MKLSLNGGWKLRETPLAWDRDSLWRVMALEDGWMDCDVPCDVHTPLEAAGRIRDVTLADYSFEAEWTQKRAWWFVKRFSGADVYRDADAAELVLESLDARADVFLNGEWLGGHFSAHYPFVALVNERLLPGENVLAVRLTDGLEEVSERDLAELNWAVSSEKRQGCPARGDIRRAYSRKPQYTVGWDWAPKAVTCGIVKDVYIRAFSELAIRAARAVTLEAREGGIARICVSLEIESFSLISTKDVDVAIRVEREGELRAECLLKDQLLTAGLNYFDAELEISDARLWWPNGYGEQPLYTVSVAATCGGARESYPAFQMGLRTVEMDVSRTADGNRDFAFIVNGARIFCRGANWVPADSIYARISAEKYEALVSEAREANMNMLRVWGGGLYEADAFYEACDRQGILLWHDFMLACACYPDHLKWFRELVESEMEYQTRRLRSHACLALWCGNNENHGIMGGRFDENAEFPVADLRYGKQYGLSLSNALGRAVVQRNCPEIPYWNSSPYGGEGANSGEMGDTHLWGLVMNKEMKYRIEPFAYDQASARFISEYGYPGACAEESIRRYFDGAPVDRGGKIWDLHNNTFEKNTCAAGIAKHYGERAEELPLGKFILYSQLVQMTMLGYSVEAFRYKRECAGVLFWMFSDAWGEVGWSAVDYYMRRKAAFYGVKRANAPVKLTLRADGEGRALLQGCNDTGEDAVLEGAWCGYVPLDGGQRRGKALSITIPARSRGRIAALELPDEDYTRGVFVVDSGLSDVGWSALRRFDAREMKYAPGDVRVLEETRENGMATYRLTADVYLHGVHSKTYARCSDNYFDLLPGEVKTVTAQGDERVVWESVN